MSAELEVNVTESLAKPSTEAAVAVAAVPQPLDVLITGAMGQIGGSLMRRLAARGHCVMPLLSDIRDTEALVAEILRYKRARAEFPGFNVKNMCAVNAAALVGTITCDIAGNEAYDVNVIGALNVAQAAVECGIEHVVQLSTTAIYDPQAPRPYTEASPIRPHTRYGHTKAEAESRLTEHWTTRDTSRYSLTIVRPCFCYGGAEDRVSTVKGLVDAALGSRPYIVQLAPHNHKDWMHIQDFTRAFVDLIETRQRMAAYLPGVDVFNIARGKPTLFLEVQEFLRGHDLYPKYAIERPSDDYLGNHIVSIARLRELIGTYPENTYLTITDWLNAYLKKVN